MKNTALLIFLLAVTALAQRSPVSSAYAADDALSGSLKRIVIDLGLDGSFDAGEDGMEQISLAVIDLNGAQPRFGGVTPENFIYPASVYKMYVAAEVLHQASEGRYTLTTPIIVRSPNDVDRSKQLDWDPRPLIRAGDTVTVGYLLDLMITRSDNSAANCLIDLARREKINAFMHENNWYGSEVTRKYLRRKFEDAGYDTIRGTETSALHAADFMYKAYTNQLGNYWTSMQLKSFLSRQLDTTKLATGLPSTAMFLHKTGWFSYWTHDVGIVDDGTIRYIVACFLPLREEIALGKMKELSARIYALIQQRNAKR